MFHLIKPPKPKPKLQKIFFKETWNTRDAQALAEINAPAAPDIFDRELRPNKVKPYTPQQGRIYWIDRDTASYLTAIKALNDLQKKKFDGKNTRFNGIFNKFSIYISVKEEDAVTTRAMSPKSFAAEM
ncbi:MAG: hypothetical protein EZS28_011550 [Streblomastix strix]|uniref:Uncharacterized protein n=1 Tax=Streblomastix strix TaxID=222440 RepID=A0A5J4WD61_9EUKA|nr:MAG: hypothetical protein EZS28_011550 [Streblomastix strix]